MLMAILWCGGCFPEEYYDPSFHITISKCAIKIQSVYLDIRNLDENILDLLAEDRKSSESDITNEIEDREVHSDDDHCHGRDKLPLDRLYDKIEARLRALESLGLKSKENTAWLFPMVESCLAEDVLKAWQKSSLFGQPEENDRSRLTKPI
ncbi:DUF1758 domain-containing protein [Trichonephila clavipes]|nr:DUF1758 domain-containing protein [Trichonephila clavipes]